MSLNRVVILGRFVADPELKHTSGDVSVCSFTLAVDRDRKSKDGEKITDFVDCVAWRSTAEFIAKYFSKGSQAAVLGSLESNKWEDKEGNKRLSWEVQVQNIYFASSARKDDSGEKAHGSPDYDRLDSLVQNFDNAHFAELDDEDGNLPY